MGSFDTKLECSHLSSRAPMTRAQARSLAASRLLQSQASTAGTDDDVDRESGLFWKTS